MHLTPSSLTSAAYTEVNANPNATARSEKRLIVVSFSISKVVDSMRADRSPSVRHPRYDRYITANLYTLLVHLSLPIAHFFKVEMKDTRPAELGRSAETAGRPAPRVLIRRPSLQCRPPTPRSSSPIQESAA